MKIGGEYKLNQIGPRQWHRFARKARVDADVLITQLTAMAKQLPDEVNAARKRSREAGLKEEIIERLATQLIARAAECQRILGRG
jgi:serine/threonine-protein kinase HipA